MEVRKTSSSGREEPNAKSANASEILQLHEGDGNPYTYL